MDFLPPADPPMQIPFQARDVPPTSPGSIRLLASRRSGSRELQSRGGSVSFEACSCSPSRHPPRRSRRSIPPSRVAAERRAKRGRRSYRRSRANSGRGPSAARLRRAPTRPPLDLSWKHAYGLATGSLESDGGAWTDGARLVRLVLGPAAAARLAGLWLLLGDASVGLPRGRVRGGSGRGGSRRSGRDRDRWPARPCRPRSARPGSTATTPCGRPSGGRSRSAGRRRPAGTGHTAIAFGDVLTSRTVDAQDGRGRRLPIALARRRRATRRRRPRVRELRGDDRSATRSPARAARASSHASASSTASGTPGSTSCRSRTTTSETSARQR